MAEEIQDEDLDLTDEVTDLGGTFSMLLDVHPGLAGTDFIKGLATKPEGGKPEGGKPEPVKTEPVKPEGGKQEPVKTEPVKTDGDKPEGKIPNNTPFFAKAPVKSEEIVPMGSSEEWAKAINSKFGIDTSADNWETTFFSSTEKWRADSTKAAQMESQIKEHNDFLADLPDELKIPMLALVQGEDWKAALKEAASGAIDFNKKFEDLPTESLVRHYIKDEDFTDEDFTAEGLKDPKMKSFLRAAQASFNADKKHHNSKRDEVYATVTAKQNAYKASVEASVGELKKELPFFGDKEAEELRDLLDTRGFLKMFIGDDGVLTKDAAKMLAFAKHGDHLLALAKDASFADGVTDKNSKVIKNASKDPSKAPGKDGKDAPSQEELLEQIKRGVTENWGNSGRTY